MQAFTISAAKRMNAALTRVNPETQVLERRKGKVFSDRYHAEVISNRRQARHALAYVLNNWRKHREDARTNAPVDRFSSGISFRGWTAHADPEFRFLVPTGYEPMVVWEPRTWLLSVGWMIYGRIDFFEIPSAPHGARERRRAKSGA